MRHIALFGLVSFPFIAIASETPVTSTDCEGTGVSGRKIINWSISCEVMAETADIVEEEHYCIPLSGDATGLPNELQEDYAAGIFEGSYTILNAVPGGVTSPCPTTVTAGIIYEGTTSATQSSVANISGFTGFALDYNFKALGDKEIAALAEGGRAEPGWAREQKGQIAQKNDFGMYQLKFEFLAGIATKVAETHPGEFQSTFKYYVYAENSLGRIATPREGEGNGTVN